jgi:hypothetical protein
MQVYTPVGPVGYLLGRLWSKAPTLGLCAAKQGHCHSTQQHKESRSPELSWYVLHSCSLSFSPIFLFGCLSLFYYLSLLCHPYFSANTDADCCFHFISFLINTHHSIMLCIRHSSLPLAVCLSVCLCPFLLLSPLLLLTHMLALCLVDCHLFFVFHCNTLAMSHLLLLLEIKGGSWVSWLPCRRRNMLNNFVRKPI